LNAFWNSNVLHHAVHPVFSRKWGSTTSMRKSGPLFAPGAAEAEEETLLRGVSVDGSRRGTVWSAASSAPAPSGDAGAVIGCVFAQSEAAVEIVHRNETAVLVNDDRRLFNSVPSCAVTSRANCLRINFAPDRQSRA
jgi:hypothetical protein